MSLVHYRQLLSKTTRLNSALSILLRYLVRITVLQLDSTFPIFRVGDSKTFILKSAYRNGLNELNKDRTIAIE